jgi:Leucine-rich repeat (LRR) protein
LPSLSAPRMTILSDRISLDGATDLGTSDPFLMGERIMPVFDIIRHKDTPTPVVIAVAGSAGTGKTSALKWLCHQSGIWSAISAEERDGHPVVLPVWISARKYQTEKCVLGGTVSEIVLQSLRYFCENESDDQVVRDRILRAVQTCGAVLGRKFLRGVKTLALSRGLTDVLPAEISGDEGEEFCPEFCTEACVEFFSTLFGSDGMAGRIAVFIDDLDYIQPGVMIAVFDAISIYLQHSGLVFVAGIDLNVAQTLITKHFSQHGYDEIQSRLYLSKLFQVECHIEPSLVQVKKFYEAQYEQLDRQTGYCLRDYISPQHRDYIRVAVLHIARNNPRKIKLHLNSALMSGYATLQNSCSQPDHDHRALLFAQGVQVYLLHRWLSLFSCGGGAIYREDVLNWFAALSAAACSSDCPAPGPVAGNRQEPFLNRPSDEGVLAAQFTPPDGLNLNMIHDWVWNLLKIPFSTAIAGHFSQPGITASAAQSSSEKEPDPLQGASSGLRDVLAADLEKAVADLSAADLQKITCLNLSGRHQSVADLTLIGGMEGLEHLNLHNTALDSLEWIISLRNLKSLNLSCTPLKDITPLSSLSGLETLDLSYSGVVDIEPLASLPKISTLVLYSMPIRLTPKGTVCSVSAYDRAFEFSYDIA